MTEGWTTIRLDGALNLSDSLESGQAFRWRKTADPEMGEHYEGVVFRNLVRVRQEGESILFTSAPDSAETIEPLLVDYLGMGHDLDAIYGDLMGDERVASGIAAYPGMRLQRQDPWECLVSFICSANNNIARISQNVEDISSAFGEPIRGAGTERRAFPSAEAIAAAGEEALRELRLGFRAKYVASASERVAGGEVDLFALREAPYDETLEAITELPGVGDKVGNCVMLFSLDKLEAFPVDVWIDRALRDWYLPESEGKPIPRTRMRVWAQERFGRYAGYANQYLFHSRRLQGK